MAPPTASDASRQADSATQQPAQPKPPRRSRKRNNGPPQLQFLTATDPSQFKDEKARKSVRSQAMIHFRGQKRKDKEKESAATATATANVNATSNSASTSTADPIATATAPKTSTTNPTPTAAARAPLGAKQIEPKAAKKALTTTTKTATKIGESLHRHVPPAPAGKTRSHEWWEEDKEELYESTLEAWRNTSPHYSPIAAPPTSSNNTTALSIPFRPNRYIQARNALPHMPRTDSVLDYEQSPEHDQKLLDIAVAEATKRFPRGFGNGMDPFLVLPKFSSRELDSFMLVRTCNRTFSSASTLQRWLPAMLSHPHILLSSTIVASTWMDMHAGTRGDSRRTAVVKGEILSWIKGRLASPELMNADSTMIVIIHLLAGEMWSCNERTLRWHEMGVAKLIAQRGGMEVLGAAGPVGITCASICAHSNIICEVKALPEFASWSPPPVPDDDSMGALPESPLFYSTPELAPVLRDPACNPFTYELICDMRDLTDLFIAQHSSVDTASGVVDADAESSSQITARPISTAEYNRRLAEIRTKLALLPSAMVPGHSSSGDFVYEACRLASIIYTSAIITGLPLSVAAEPARNAVLLDPACVNPDFTRRLTQSLYEIMERTNVGDIWGDMCGVFYWVTSVGAAASRTSVTTHMYQEPTSLNEEYTTWIRRCLIMFTTRALIILVFKHPVPVSLAQKRLLRVQGLLASGRVRPVG